MCRPPAYDNPWTFSRCLILLLKMFTSWIETFLNVLKKAIAVPRLLSKWTLSMTTLEHACIWRAVLNFCSTSAPHSISCKLDRQRLSMVVNRSPAPKLAPTLPSDRLQIFFEHCSFLGKPDSTVRLWVALLRWMQDLQKTFVKPPLVSYPTILRWLQFSKLTKQSSLCSEVPSCMVKFEQSLPSSCDTYFKLLHGM